MTTMQNLMAATLFALCGTAQAQAPAHCRAPYDVVQAQLERDLAALQARGDKAGAQQRMMRGHDELQAAGRRADECERQARATAPGAADKAARAEECRKRVTAKLDEGLKRYAGIAKPSAEQQRAQHELQLQISDERAACGR